MRSATRFAIDGFEQGIVRTPSSARYERMLDVVAAQGYDIGKVQKVPQKWK